MREQSGKVVLITGCSSGIGRALAEEMTRRGCRVFASARRLESIADLADVGMETVQLDVTDAGSMDAAVARVLEDAGRIDMLVNNAGFGLMGPVLDLPAGDLRRQFETNVTGAIALTQRVCRPMAAAGSGRIVNIESVMALMVTPFAGAYCASKAAMFSLSEALRMELSPLGIDVVSVQPGGVRSRFADNASAQRQSGITDDSLYARYAPAIEKRIGMSQKGATDADLFARKVAGAILRAKAPRIVRYGNGATTLPLMAGLLPGGLRAALFRRVFGLR